MFQRLWRDQQGASLIDYVDPRGTDHRCRHFRRGFLDAGHVGALAAHAGVPGRAPRPRPIEVYAATRAAVVVNLQPYRGQGIPAITSLPLAARLLTEGPALGLVGLEQVDDRLDFSLFVRTDWGSLHHRATDTLFSASDTGPSVPLLLAGVVHLIPWSKFRGTL